MLTPTCPIPNNINPLQSNGFMFNILKLPEIQFFCQSVVLPEISFPSVTVPTPLSAINIPNTQLRFSDLNVTFIIDEDMNNYIAVHNWLIGLGFPESHMQYQNFLNQHTNSLNASPLASGYSDAVLSILTSTNTPNRIVRFVDVFPIYLGKLDFASTSGGPNNMYLACSAVFKFNYYTFE